MNAIGSGREKGFRLMMSHEEHAMLLSIATTDGVSAASWLRQAVRREWTARNEGHLGVRMTKKRARKKK